MKTEKDIPCHCKKPKGSGALKGYKVCPEPILPDCLMRKRADRLAKQQLAEIAAEKGFVGPLCCLIDQRKPGKA